MLLVAPGKVGTVGLVGDVSSTVPAEDWPILLEDNFDLLLESGDELLLE